MYGEASQTCAVADPMRPLKLRAVIAPSFSGLFFRNAFNLGLLLLTCREAGELAEGDQVSLDLQQMASVTADGRRLGCDRIPGFLLDMVQAGGLMNQLRRKLQRQE